MLPQVDKSQRRGRFQRPSEPAKTAEVGERERSLCSRTERRGPTGYEDDGAPSTLLLLGATSDSFGTILEISCIDGITMVFGSVVIRGKRAAAVRRAFCCSTAL